MIKREENKTFSLRQSKGEDIYLEFPQDKLNNITNFLGEEEVMLQLSEECSELIQALLKYRRSTKGLTPKTTKECKENIIEELSDVLINIKQLIYLNDDFQEKIKDIQIFKINRWYDRLFKKKNK